MDEFLKEYNLIDLKGLAILKYKTLGLTENEILVLLLIMTLQTAGQKGINYDIWENYMNLEKREIDQILVGLVNKKMIRLVGTTISLEDFYKRLVFDVKIKEEDMTKGINLVESFEQEFAKALSPMELETLKSWKQMGYSDQMILDALREATLKNIHSMRYIEKILIDWAKNGVRRSNSEVIEDKEDDEEFVEYRWWEDNG